MITTQQRIPGITTECPPAITAVGDKYILAWTNNDATMSWTTLSVNSSQDGYDRGDIKATGFSTTAGYGPALTNLGGAVWMAWLENPEQAPFIPPSVQRRQPPVIMVSSLSGSTWSRAQPLWNPGLTGSDLYQDSYQGPAAVSSPALAATESELFAVWIENAVNGSDALALFYEGTLASPPAQPTIFFAKWRSGSGWTQRQAVPNALSASAPALAAFNGVVSMAFKGHEDAQIWFAQYTNDKGWTARAKLPGFDTATGPGLAVGDTGNVHMVWVKHSSNNLVAATLGEDGKWSSEAPGTGWSTPLPLPVIETGLPPALGSQSSASDTVTLAITGASNKDIVVMPMTAFAVVANPPFGLGSNSNYIFADDDKALTDVVVTIDVTEDIVLQSNGPPQQGLSPVAGFGFQLNAYSPKPKTGVWPVEASAWQQYVIAINGTQLSGSINNWPETGNYLTDQWFGLASVPDNNRLPAGYKLKISLQNDQKGTITGATYEIVDNHGKTLANVMQSISLSSSDLSPIIAFELNLVGPGNGESASLSSGAGTISYAASNLMTALSLEPDYAESSYFTGETANTSYGPLTGYPSKTATQTFRLAAAETPMIHKKTGKLLNAPPQK